MSSSTARRWLLRLVAIPVALVLAVYLGLAASLQLEQWRASDIRPAGEPVYERTTSPHVLTLVDDGPTSFAERIRLIERAKRTIELEFFIYELDTASRLLTHKLVERAKAGVKVRLLVDASLAVFKLGPTYASFLRRNGVQVRYYNTAAAYRLLAVQHRSHRKLLIVDDATVMTGGRNIADDYFHASAHFNFLDADVVIEGPLARRARETFDMYWSSKMAVEPTMDEVGEQERTAAEAFVTPTDEDRDRFAFIERESPALLARLVTHTCNDLTFATDFPGVTESHRRVFKVLTEVLDEAKKTVVGETPYFVMRPGGIALLERLGRRNVAVSVLTNSLRSTDAYYTVSALYGTLDRLASTVLTLHAYDGTPARTLVKLPLDVSHRWGVHAKRAVIDDKTIAIGTYNVDPRSANLNSELLVVCRNNVALAAQMKASIAQRIRHSWPVIAAGKVHRDDLVRDASTSDWLKMHLARPLASAFDFLL